MWLEQPKNRFWEGCCGLCLGLLTIESCDPPKHREEAVPNECLGWKHGESAFAVLPEKGSGTFTALADSGGAVEIAV